MEDVGFHVCAVVAGPLRSVRQALGSSRTGQTGCPSCHDGRSMGRAKGPRTGSWPRPVLRRWDRNPQVRGHRQVRSGGYTPSEMSFPTAGEADTFYLFQDEKTDEGGALTKAAQLGSREMS